MNDVTSRVCENIAVSLCLQLQEQYEYIDLLHTNQIEVMPESGASLSITHTLPARSMAACRHTFRKFVLPECAVP